MTAEKRVEAAYEEINRRKRIASAALANSPDEDTTWFLEESDSIADLDPTDRALIAEYGPLHVLALLDAAKATLHRHRPVRLVHDDTLPWCDPCARPGPCPDLRAMLDIYAPDR